MPHGNKKEIKLGDDLGVVGVTVNGLRLEVAADGRSVKVVSDDPVEISATVNGIRQRVMTAPVKEPVKVGQKMKDGSIFAGLTEENEYQIFVMPSDLGILHTFNKAAKAIDRLNKDKDANLGHKDWQIGSLDVMRVVQKNRNEGALKDTFETAASSSGYWSSTEHPVFPTHVHFVRFSLKNDHWSDKDNKLNCRPVRLRAVVPIR